MNLAHLKPLSPFYALFPDGCVPIKNMVVPDQAVCEGDGADPQDVYFVDLEKLPHRVFVEVVKMVREQCDPSIPLEVASQEILNRGLPLRAKHVASVSTDVPFFL